MTPFPGVVAAAVRAELARRGRTQTDGAAVLNISTQAMSKKARGITPFRVEEIRILAGWLDVPVSVLMDEPGAQEHTEVPPRQRAPLAQSIPA